MEGHGHYHRCCRSIIIMYCPSRSPRFKWQHGDLCARQWFIDCGHRFPFDMLHIVEWDMVFFEIALHVLFRFIRDGVAITNVKSIYRCAWTGTGLPRPNAMPIWESLRGFISQKVRHDIRRPSPSGRSDLLAPHSAASFWSVMQKWRRTGLRARFSTTKSACRYSRRLSA